MVRHLLQGRVDRIARLLLGPLWGPLGALRRMLKLLMRWLAAWLGQFVRSLGTRMQVGLRLANLVVHPADPNNLFTVSGSSSYEMQEAGRHVRMDALRQGSSGERGAGLLIADGQPVGNGAPTDAPGGDHAPAAATAIAAHWRGVTQPDMQRVEQATARVNYRFSYLDLMNTELRRMQAPDVRELGVVINRLAKRWLDLDEDFASQERRNRLDIRRTLKYNLPRYGGYVLDFKWGTKEMPVPKFTKPARLLVIGDVSHSMVQYAAVSLYFMHMLNFVFQVDSYIFSQKATRSTPYLNGPGSFEDKLKDLMQNATSWNAGTRFGSSLEFILAHANVDQYTNVVIATDGKVTLGHGEYELIERHMARLHRRARRIVFLTPEAAFAGSHGQRAVVERIGSFESGMFNIPIFDLGQIWYNTLGKYADRVYHVRSVQDLVDACDDLYRVSRD